MVALQIISKVLESKDISIIEDNLLTEDYFQGFENEYEFIMDHYEQYGTVPDKATFLGVFDDMELVEVTESDEYLVNTIREENLYYRSIPVVKKIAELLKSDSNAAVEYMHHALKDLQPDYHIGGMDIIKQHKEIEQSVRDRRNKDILSFISTGFKELDDITGGLQVDEELCVLIARINEGKSWVVEQILTHIWKIGLNVGLLSPEMGAISIGLRFDTLHGHFSNSGLFKGTDDVDMEEYEKYSQELATHTNRFLVSTPEDFQKKVTVSKLRNWIKQNKFDVIAIDGITYLTDERYKKGDSMDISLTNLSQDLKLLTAELHVPIIIVVQANRGAVTHDDESNDTPELEHVRYSDGIAQAATQVIALRQQKESGVLLVEPKKGRNNALGKKLSYQWDINYGKFEFLECTDKSRRSDNNVQKEERKKEKRTKSTKTGDITDAF